MPACSKPPPGDIGLVDVPRITSNWPKFLNYQNQLNADVAAIQRLARVRQRQAARSWTDCRRASRRIRRELTDNVRDAAQQVANDKHLHYVLTRQFVGYGGVDITPDVEKILNIDGEGDARPVTADLGTLAAIAERTGGRVDR